MRDIRAKAEGILLAAVVLVACTCGVSLAAAQDDKDVHWSADEKPLADKIDGLRGLPATGNKLRSAIYLAGLSTEGDFGHDMLQQVAATLAATLRERPLPWTEPTESIPANSPPH